MFFYCSSDSGYQSSSTTHHRPSLKKIPRKIFKFKRENFRDDASWQQFATITNQLRNKIKCQRRQITRAKNANKKMRDIISALKKNKEFDSLTEYLQVNIFSSGIKYKK